MSQLGRKAGPDPPGPAPHCPGPGTFDYVAGFRIGRGRDNRTPQQGQQQPRQQPYGTQAPPPPYGQQPWPPTGGNGTPYTAGRPGGHQGNGGYGGAHGEPEYFGDPYNQPQQPHRGDPYANNPGHTQAFSIDEDPYGDGNTYRAGQAPPSPQAPACTGRIC